VQLQLIKAVVGRKNTISALCRVGAAGADGMPGHISRGLANMVLFSNCSGGSGF
jgi:hypothetical protein